MKTTHPKFVKGINLCLIKLNFGSHYFVPELRIKLSAIPIKLSSISRSIFSLNTIIMNNRKDCTIADIQKNILIELEKEDAFSYLIYEPEKEISLPEIPDLSKRMSTSSVLKQLFDKILLFFKSVI